MNNEEVKEEPEEEEEAAGSADMEEGEEDSQEFEEVKEEPMDDDFEEEDEYQVNYLGQQCRWALGPRRAWVGLVAFDFVCTLVFNTVCGNCNSIKF